MAKNGLVIPKKSAKKRGAGRPRTPAAMRRLWRESTLRVRLSREERALVEAAAGDEPVSTWARARLLEAARDQSAR